MNLCRGFPLAIAALILANVSTASGRTPQSSVQMPQIDPEQRYLLLAASLTSTMQMEVDYAAARGFYVVMGSSRGNSEIVLLMKRAPEKAEKRQYKLIATTDTVIFQQEIDEAGRQGYRAVPRTFINKPHVMSVTEIAVVMERSTEAARAYEYKLLATNLTSTLEKEWSLAELSGFTAVAMLTRAELMVLLEREVRPR